MHGASGRVCTLHAHQAFALHGCIRVEPAHTMLPCVPRAAWNCAMYCSASNRQSMHAWHACGPMRAA
eukprot:184733-Pleurochrysis_carterae.AAC.2